MSYLLIISTQAPYHSSMAIDAFEAALAATNVGLNVKLLFQHDGIYQCLSSQQANQIGHKNMYKKLSALALFDVEDVYLDTESVNYRGLRITNSDAFAWQAANKNKVLELQRAAQHILVF